MQFIVTQKVGSILFYLSSQYNAFRSGNIIGYILPL